jgi:predicted permease
LPDWQVCCPRCVLLGSIRLQRFDLNDVIDSDWRIQSKRVTFSKPERGEEMLRSLIEGMRALVHAAQRNAQIEDELKSFFEASVEDKIRNGMSLESARRAAQVEIGSREMVRHKTWSAGWEANVDSFARDLRFAARQLKKSPGFAFAAVLTLALGIGATTAIFTLVQQVMMQSLPVAKPQQLWRIGDKIHCCEWGGYTQDPEYFIFSWPLYRYFREHTPAFSDLAAFQGGTPDFGVRRAGSSQPAQGRISQFVSGNFFHTFGIGPWIGRVLGDADDHAGAVPVAVMSYRAWEQKYGGDRSVVGATFEMDGTPVTVVGVAPPGFFGAMQSSYANPDFWIPLADEPVLMGSSSLLHQENENWLDIIGRVWSGTDPRTLESRLKVELHQWQLSHLADMSAEEKQFLPKQQLHLTPGGSGVAQLREGYRDDLRLLLIAAGCVLLIACANLANLLLARGLKDRPQAAIRAALGASRARLVRKALAESLSLGVLGAAVGVGFAYLGVSLILHLAFTGPDTWVPITASPSWTMLLFALGLALVTGVLFGIAPALMASRTQPIDALRGANRSTGSGTAWPQKTLVVVQAAISLVLLSAAALLGMSLRNMEHLNFGFQTEDRYIVWVDPTTAGYRADQLESLYTRLLDRLRSIPGVRAASAAQYSPMSGDNRDGSVRIEGQPAPSDGHGVYASWDRITPGYFASIGDRVVLGRPFTKQDTATSLPVAVVNEAFAKTFFKGENPLGRHFGRGVDMKHAGDYEIVGVVANTRWEPWEMRQPVRPMYYLPESQTLLFSDPNQATDEARSHYLLNVILWAQGDPQGLEAQTRKALADVDPNLPLGGFDPYQHVLESNFTQSDLLSELTSLFGLLALVLAAVGLYGVTAYGVGQRTSEIGVRVALGADRSSVMAMVLRSAFGQVAIGLALGIPAAIGAGWAMSSQLFGVRPWHPETLSVAVLLLGCAALVAATIPARRAASLDPMCALRAE